jgi:hypothetical protein
MDRDKIFDQMMTDLGVPHYLMEAAKSPMTATEACMGLGARRLQAKHIARLVDYGIDVGLISKTIEDAKMMTDEIRQELERLRDE